MSPTANNTIYLFTLSLFTLLNVKRYLKMLSYRPLNNLLDESVVIQKQMMVMTLLPDKLLWNLINEYVFMDKKEYELRKHYKNYICYAIQMSNNDRTHGFMVEHWAFWFPEWVGVVHRENIHLQGVNCRFCGNYIMTNVSINTQKYILCICDREMRQEDINMRYIQSLSSRRETRGNRYRTLPPEDEMEMNLESTSLHDDDDDDFDIDEFNELEAEYNNRMDMYDLMYEEQEFHDPEFELDTPNNDDDDDDEYYRYELRRLSR